MRYRIVRMMWITRAFVREHRDHIFLFGDNLIRRGLGGQAAAMRGEPMKLGYRPRNSPAIAKKPSLQTKNSKKGFVYGRTAETRPLIAVENPVTISDLHATIMTAMGISPQAGFEIEGRPFYVTQDAKGKAVKELFAT